MEITDLTATLLIRLELQGKLTPLRKINYQDVRIGDIFLKGGDWGDEWTAIHITGKNIKGDDYGRWSLGEKLLTYDVYHIKDDEVVLEVKSHNYSYQGLVKELWKYLKIPHQPIITLNYPREDIK
jgi:hypothetical protein|tara:strand:- start:198 stop:572 length:375 start_codon:yes stop_codon:yes gene_type:complete